MMSDRATTCLRLLALAVVIAGLVVVGTRPSVQTFFELENLRDVTANAGFLGMLAFVGICTAGYLMRIPGVLFVLAAILGWGSWAGGVVSFVGLTVAISVSFFAMRAIGGSPISKIDSDWVRKILGQLDDHPVRTVALLRLVFFVNPIVNLSLVLTDVRFRDYFVGSIIGCILPLVVITLAADSVLAFVV